MSKLAKFDHYLNLLILASYIVFLAIDIVHRNWEPVSSEILVVILANQLCFPRARLALLEGRG